MRSGTRATDKRMTSFGWGSAQSSGSYGRGRDA